MDKLIIIIDEEGKLESVLSNSEVDIRVLHKGVNDREIDTAQMTLDEVEIEN